MNETFPEHWHTLDTNTWIFYSNIYSLCECDSVKLSLITYFFCNANMFIICNSVLYCYMFTSPDCWQVRCNLLNLKLNRLWIRYILLTWLMLIWKVVVLILGVSSFTLRLICQAKNSRFSENVNYTRQNPLDLGHVLDIGSAHRVLTDSDRNGANYWGEILQL